VSDEEREERDEPEAPPEQLEDDIAERDPLPGLDPWLPPPPEE
jgi:hypothetical protein